VKVEDIDRMIEEREGVLLYFRGRECNVCHALEPKVERLFEERFPLLERIFLDAHENREISARFGVFSVPTIIVFLGGREFVREGRAVSLHALEQKLSRPYAIMTGE
jgi:thioredoxin-like negative regulator of GroEL